MDFPAPNRGNPERHPTTEGADESEDELIQWLERNLDAPPDLSVERIERLLSRRRQVWLELFGTEPPPFRDDRDAPPITAAARESLRLYNRGQLTGEARQTIEELLLSVDGG